MWPYLGYLPFLDSFSVYKMEAATSGQSAQVVLMRAQSCLTLCDPMDCSPPGSCIHGILHARILEWVAISFSRGIFLTQGSNLCLLHLLIGRWVLRDRVLLMISSVLWSPLAQLFFLPCWKMKAVICVDWSLRILLSAALDLSWKYQLQDGCLSPTRKEESGARNQSLSCRAHGVHKWHEDVAKALMSGKQKPPFPHCLDAKKQTDQHRLQVQFLPTTFYYHTWSACSQFPESASSITNVSGLR